MREETSRESATLALSTKLEEDFVSPLTALRGALEILRDHQDLTAAERERFIDVALSGCDRLETGIRELGTTVYSAGRRALETEATEVPSDEGGEYASRFRFIEDKEIVEVDLSGLEFSSSQVVNDFYDSLEQRIRATGHLWYLLVNYQDCSIWPESWVAFAHRAKKIRANFALETLRYTPQEGGPDAGQTAAGPAPGTDMYPSRESALARIEALRSESGRKAPVPLAIG